MSALPEARPSDSVPDSPQIESSRNFLSNAAEWARRLRNRNIAVAALGLAATTLLTGSSGDVDSPRRSFEVNQVVAPAVNNIDVPSFGETRAAYHEGMRQLGYEYAGPFDPISQIMLSAELGVDVTELSPDLAQADRPEVFDMVNSSEDTAEPGNNISIWKILLIADSQGTPLLLHMTEQFGPIRTDWVVAPNTPLKDVALVVNAFAGNHSAIPAGSGVIDVPLAPESDIDPAYAHARYAMRFTKSEAVPAS